MYLPDHCAGRSWYGAYTELIPTGWHHTEAYKCFQSWSFGSSHVLGRGALRLWCDFCRQSAIDALAELRSCAPERRWRLIQVAGCLDDIDKNKAHLLGELDFRLTVSLSAPSLHRQNAYQLGPMAGAYLRLGSELSHAGVMCRQCCAL